MLGLMDPPSNYLFSLILLSFYSIFWGSFSVLYINISMNYLCLLIFLISQSYSLIVSFLEYLVFVLWMHYFILSLRGHLLFFKTVFCSLYCLFPLSFFFFSFPIWYCLSWQRLLSTTWWSFAVRSYLRVSHYKRIWKLCVNKKNLSVGGFPCRIIKWGPICFVNRPSSLSTHRLFFWDHSILSFPKLMLRYPAWKICLADSNVRVKQNKTAGQVSSFSM